MTGHGSWSDFERQLNKVQRLRYLDDCVELQDGRLGKIRYIGARKGFNGVWIGVELQHINDGEHNGTDDGIEYFRAERRTASFIRVEDIVRSLSSPLRERHLEERADPLVGLRQMQRWFDNDDDIPSNRRGGRRTSRYLDDNPQPPSRRRTSTVDDLPLRSNRRTSELPMGRTASSWNRRGSPSPPPYDRDRSRGGARGSEESF